MSSNSYQKSVNHTGDAVQHEDPFGDVSEQLDGIELIDLTAVDEVKLEHPTTASPSVHKSLRNYGLVGGHRSVKQVAAHGISYQVGHFVELRQLVGVYQVAKPKGQQIQFLEIKSINVHNETGNVVIRGLPYARTRNLYGCLHRMQNEVCLILEIDVDDADEEQALLQIEPEQILRKRILTKTNKSFPDCRFDEVAYVTKEQKEDQAPLTCRWKMHTEYKDATQRRAGRLQSQRLVHLSESDSDIKKRNLGVDKQRSREWRGETIPGGSFDFVKEEDSGPVRIQRYSFAEVSAGAGGASRGAELAGFKIVLATEPCLHACDSYRTNFPNIELYQMETTELTADESQFAVDVLYISSSALSVAGDDEEAVEKLCTDVLKKFHPRYVMMKQPATIISERKAPLLNAIISGFTKAGYSIHWKIVQMAEYGLPQMRKRLIMIGAGPGERLPTWPAITHSSNPTRDQQPLATEEEAIRGLNSHLHSLHNPETLRVINRAARDADKPLDSVINGSGSLYPHPDGEREFTLRELASLQGFPTYHEFKGSYIKKQIGTAFPPSVAMAFYQHLRQHMEELDSVYSNPPEPFELSGAPSASTLPETGNAKEASSSQSLETPGASGTADAREATPDAMETVFQNDRPARSANRQRIEAAMLPFSPCPTMSPETQQITGPKSPVSHHTPSPAQQLPTPSTGGHFIAGRRAAALRLKRDRAVFEEPESDGDGDDSGPETLQTPSKRSRASVSREWTHDPLSDGSRTALGSSNIEDAPMSEDANVQEGSCLDGDVPEMVRDFQPPARRSGSYEGEV